MSSTTDVNDLVSIILDAIELNAATATTVAVPPEQVAEPGGAVRSSSNLLSPSSNLLSPSSNAPLPEERGIISPGLVARDSAGGQEERGVIGPEVRGMIGPEERGMIAGDSAGERGATPSRAATDDRQVNQSSLVRDFGGKASRDSRPSGAGKADQHTGCHTGWQAAIQAGKADQHIQGEGSLHAFPPKSKAGKAGKADQAFEHIKKRPMALGESQAASKKEKEGEDGGGGGDRPLWGFSALKPSSPNAPGTLSFYISISFFLY